MPRGGSEAELARAREVLRNLIELSGASRREIEQRLVEQGRGTDLGRLLNGKLALKLRHVLDICQVIEIHPLEFFRIVFKEPVRPSPLRQQLNVLIGTGEHLSPSGAKGSPAPPVLEIEELLGRVAKLLRQLEEQLPAAVSAARTR